MIRLCIILAGVLGAVLSAPTVHLQDYIPESSVFEESTSVNSVTEPPKNGAKPHIVDPVWITVTMPPTSYIPTGTDSKPNVMPPYISYVPVPPFHQLMPGSWPLFYPNMPYYTNTPYPYPSNHLCNQQTNSYPVT